MPRETPGLGNSVRRLLAAGALLLVASTPARAEWQTADSVLLGATMAVMALDWGQTRDLVRRPDFIRNCPTCFDPYRERNPILGKGPTIGQVDKYFALSMIGTAALAVALPQKYRRWFLGAVLTVEVWQVHQNHQIGLRVEY